MPEISVVESVVRMATFTYSVGIEHRADFNAIRAAIEIYLAKAKTGQLPETLPGGLPKDPYSDQDFEYEKSREGFVLRCRVIDLKVKAQRDEAPPVPGQRVPEIKPRQYEFKVKNGS